VYILSKLKAKELVWIWFVTKPGKLNFVTLCSSSEISKIKEIKTTFITFYITDFFQILNDSFNFLILLNLSEKKITWRGKSDEAENVSILMH